MERLVNLRLKSRSSRPTFADGFQRTQVTIRSLAVDNADRLDTELADHVPKELGKLLPVGLHCLVLHCDVWVRKGAELFRRVAGRARVIAHVDGDEAQVVGRCKR